MKRVVIVHHGYCFDGMASAALLGRFLLDQGSTLITRGLSHQVGGSFVPRDVLTGDVNAVVDFRYTTAPELHWYFDHHRTGIVGEEEMAHFRASAGKRKFYDPAYGSCCLFIRDVLRDRFGFEAPELDEMVRWAHTIDTAGFSSAAAAASLAEPAMQLMTVIEAHGDDDLLGPRIARLAAGEPLAAIAADDAIQSRLAPLRRARERADALVASRAVVKDSVVFIDLGDEENLRFHKFVPYQLFPDAIYCVAVLRLSSRLKVSVGYNPWSGSVRTHDISELCAAHGGGGHPVVGAVSLPPDDLPRARRVAEEICGVLRA